MFIGHYAVGLGAKKFIPQLNLAWLIFACQLLDLIWPALVLFNVEFVAVEPGATQVTPLNFISYPFSHSLIMAVVYALLLMVLLKRRYYLTLKHLMIAGGVVVSHWVLDYITHRPDMPIFFNTLKVGLGLWNYLAFTVVVEVSMFAFGVYWYLKNRGHASKRQNYLFWSMIGFLGLLYIGNIFGPVPPINTPSVVIAGSGLALWSIIPWAYFADRR